MTKIVNALERRLPLITFILIVCQPAMDVLSFWMDKAGLSNLPTLALRCLVLALTVLLGFVMSRKKWVYGVTAAVCALLFAGHLFAIWQFGIQNLFTDLTNWVRVLQMPLTAISLISFLKRNAESYTALRRGAVVSLLVILAVEALSVITGTDPHTYQLEQMGTIGWFSNTNSQSCILTMLVPVAAVWAYEKKGFRGVWFWVILCGGMAAMFFLATRLGYLGIAATGVGIGLSMLIINVKQWKKAAVFVAAALVFALLIPVSPMTRHQRIYFSLSNTKQGYVAKTLEEFEGELEPLDEPGADHELTEEELEERKRQWVIALTPVYELYIPDFVEIFGLEETMEMYDFTYQVTDLTQIRPKKLQYARLLQNRAPASAKAFGLELSRFTVKDQIYDVENDFHGIYFLFGFVGLAVLLCFLGYFLFLIVRALIRDPKRTFTLEAASWGIALVMCLIHAYCTAGVLRRPNASVYLSVTLAAVYYLVKLRKPDAAEAQEIQ